MAFEDFLTQQYEQAFGRPIDPVGKEWWGSRLESGAVPTTNFQKTLFEGAAWDPNATKPFTTDPNLPTSDFLNLGYQQAFGREADPEGANYWGPLLESGEIPKENFLQNLFLGAAANPSSLSGPYIPPQPESTSPRLPRRDIGKTLTPAGPQLFDVEDLVERGIYNKSFSGLDPNSELVKTLLPFLTEQAQRLPEQAEEFTGTLQGFFKNLMQQSLGPQAFQGTLNQLAGRNVLNSSIASDALAKAQTGIASDIGQRGFESQLAGLQQQMGVPGRLAQLLGGAGKISESQDPLGPYRLMAQFLA